jgi:hypothetical protein
MNSLLAGQSRVLVTLGLLNVVIAEKVLGIPQAELANRLDLDRLNAAFYALVGGGQGNG